MVGVDNCLMHTHNTIMRRSFKYRIEPNNVQRTALYRVFNFCRFLYNSALEERIDRYKRTGKGLTYNQQSAELPEIRRTFDEAKPVYSQVLQQTLKQLDAAYINFFRRIKS